MTCKSLKKLLKLKVKTLGGQNNLVRFDSCPHFGKIDMIIAGMSPTAERRQEIVFR